MAVAMVFQYPCTVCPKLSNKFISAIDSLYIIARKAVRPNAESGLTAFLPFSGRGSFDYSPVSPVAATAAS